MKFSSDKEYFLLDMCILLSLVIFRPCGRVTIVEKKLNYRAYVTIFWAVTHSCTLFWLVVGCNNFWYFDLVHSTVSVKCGPHMWGHSEWFSASNISIWVSTIPCMLLLYTFMLISFSVFLLTVHRVYWLDGSCTCNQIYHPYCVWGTTTITCGIYGQTSELQTHFHQGARGQPFKSSWGENSESFLHSILTGCRVQ